MSETKIYNIIKVLSLVGITLAVYLLYEQFSHSAFRPCNINATINCNAIIDGAVSKTLGIPTPLYGLLGYIGILASAILMKKRIIMALSTFGLLFCLWIAYQELFQLRVICPVCITCQIIMISVFMLALRLNLKKQ